MNKLKYILSFIQKILVLAKEIFFQEASDRQKIKKQIKELNDEKEIYLKAMVDASHRGHHKQFQYYSDKLRQLQAETDRLYRILSE